MRSAFPTSGIRAGVLRTHASRLPVIAALIAAAALSFCACGDDKGTPDPNEPMYGVWVGHADLYLAGEEPIREPMTLSLSKNGISVRVEELNFPATLRSLTPDTVEFTVNISNRVVLCTGTRTGATITGTAVAGAGTGEWTVTRPTR